MRKIKRNVLKSFMFICSGLTIMTITIAAVAAYEVPSRPGMPLVIKIQKDGGLLDYLAPRSDGGTPVTDYLIEYRNQWGTWKFKGTYKTLQYPLVNMQEGSVVQFRVRAVNAAGISVPSKISDFTKFRDPYGSK